MKIPTQFSVFPVEGKRPLVPWAEYSRRQPTADELAAWKAKYSQWGIATGPVSRVLVLDDDGGLDVSKYQIPRTLTQKTPRGGTHYFFRWTPELDSRVTTKVGVLPGVDVRGQGGYAVFYGFTTPHWLTPLAVPPQWLLDLLPNKVGHSQTANNYSQIANKSHLQELLDGIKPGNRNDSFVRVAGSLRSRGYSSSDIFTLLEPKAREVDFGLEELRLLTESVGRYQPTLQRVDETQASSIEEFLKQQEQVEWIVPGIIAQRSIGFVAGLPETGKTWILIDLAIECARGGKWLGKFPVERAKVLFVDQERFRGETQRRFRTVLASSGGSPKDLKDYLFMKCGTTTRLNLNESFEAFRRELGEIKPDLVVVDSFATFHTCQENDRKDIQAVLERIKELRNEFGCTFLFIHHENKMAFQSEDEAGAPSIAQMAGNVAIPAAAETVLTVRKKDGGSMVYHTKSTLASTAAPFLVTVTDVDATKTKIKVQAH